MQLLRKSFYSVQDFAFFQKTVMTIINIRRLSFQTTMKSELSRKRLILFYAGERPMTLLGYSSDDPQAHFPPSYNKIPAGI